MRLLLALALCCFCAPLALFAQEEPDCVVGDFDKVDCGFVGSDETSCTGKIKDIRTTEGCAPR